MCVPCLVRHLKGSGTVCKGNVKNVFQFLLIFARDQCFCSFIFFIIVPLCQTSCLLRTVHLDKIWAYLRGLSVSNDGSTKTITTLRWISLALMNKKSHHMCTIQVRYMVNHFIRNPFRIVYYILFNPLFESRVKIADNDT